MLGRPNKRRQSMPTYLITNRAPKKYRGSADTVAAWNAWFERLGANLVDRGNPVFARRMLGNCGTDTELGGYTLVIADNLEAAVALAKGCPHLVVGGGVEVGELTMLNSGLRALA
jgi:hypothetical protein